MAGQPHAAFQTGGLGTRATLAAVARHALPAVVESTLVPTAIFYVTLLALGTWAAYGAALGWAFVAVARRKRRGDRVPGILVLALLGLAVRTALAAVTGSTFLYFAQPILGTTLFAALFLASAATTRPFVARIAGDFYPLTDEVAGRRRVQRLFRRLTVLWALVQLVNAAAGLSLLVTLPTTLFVPARTVAALAITAVGVAATVVWSLRVARVEGLVGTAASI